MSMETVSTKRKRVYPRKFDHELAREMAAKGFNASEIRRHLGNTVTVTAIQRVINPHIRKRMEERTSRYLMGGTCSKCGANRTRYLHPRSKQTQMYKDSGLCRKCWGESRQTRFRLDQEENIVEVRCTKCKRWYPPEIFPKNKSGTNGYHNLCKGCGSAVRSEYRERQKVPCVVCGTLCLPPREKGSRAANVARCRPCYYDLRSGKREPLEGEPSPM